ICRTRPAVALRGWSSRRHARPEQCVLLSGLFSRAAGRVVSEIYFSGLRVEDHTIVLTLVEVEHIVERPGDCVEGPWDALATQPIVLDETHDGALVGHGVIDEVMPGIGSDNQQRQPGTIAATALGMGSGDASQDGKRPSAKSGSVERVLRGLRLVHNLSQLVIVPAI